MGTFRITETVRDRNVLTMPERIGEIVAIALIALFASYFAYLQVSNAGFMTAKFSPAEIFLFYGSFALAILASGARALIGTKDGARPFELVSNVFTAVAAIWLLIVFPFDFAHIADPLPSAIQILLSWNPNVFGWFIMLLIALVSIGVAAYNAIRLAIDNI